MSTAQRRKMKKRRKTQCELLEATCELVGIKIIYTRRNHVRLFHPVFADMAKWEVRYELGDFGPECSIGKQANARLDVLLSRMRSKR